VARVAILVQRERGATTELIVALAELDRRKLYLGQGCSSLFTYCTQVLHLSEYAAFNRIEAARVSSRFPAVLEGLQSGWLTLTAVRILSPILTADNHARLLAGAKYKSKRDVELLVAAERPQSDAPDSVRRDPQAHLPHAAASAPLSVERYCIQFTASKAVEEQLRRARRADRGSHRASLDLLLTAVEKNKWAGPIARSRSRLTARGSRHIPAALRNPSSERPLTNARR
jgi:hypothetical protein